MATWILIRELQHEYFSLILKQNQRDFIILSYFNEFIIARSIFAIKKEDYPYHL